MNAERQPRPASTVCLFLEGSSRVLMVHRGATARFMASAWVFPGGTVDDIDHDPSVLRMVGVTDPDDGPWVAAAVRELVEEVGIWLSPARVERADELMGDEIYRRAADQSLDMGGDRLALFANWVTPRGLPIRFDTRFYAGVVDRELEPDADTREIDRAEWIDVAEAIAAGRSGEMIIPFPTMRTLEYLASFGSGDDLVAHARSLAEVVAILPKVRLGDDGSMGIVLPTEAGYDELGHLDENSHQKLAAAAAQARARGGRIPEAE